MRIPRNSPATAMHRPIVNRTYTWSPSGLMKFGRTPGGGLRAGSVSSTAAGTFERSNVAMMTRMIHQGHENDRQSFSWTSFQRARDSNLGTMGFWSYIERTCFESFCAPSEIPSDSCHPLCTRGRAARTRPCRSALWDSAIYPRKSCPISKISRPGRDVTSWEIRHSKRGTQSTGYEDTGL